MSNNKNFNPSSKSIMEALNEVKNERDIDNFIEDKYPKANKESKVKLKKILLNFCNYINNQ